MKGLRINELWWKYITLFLTITFWLKGPYKVPMKEQLNENYTALYKLLLWQHIHSCVHLYFPENGTFRRRDGETYA